MDIAVLISLVVLLTITALEFICLFWCSKKRGKIRPVAAVVPVFSGDNDFDVTLEYFGRLLERGSPCIDCLFFIDYGGTDEQLRSCGEFCFTFRNAALISPDELKKNLSETFAIYKEM